MTNIWDKPKKNLMASVYHDVPPQFISFLTFVVDIIFLLRKWSASCPPMGTTMVITMWGTADKIPTCWERSGGHRSRGARSTFVRLSSQPCWWGSRRLPQNTPADWWGASRRSNCGKSWPRWWHTQAWRWRSDPMGFWISAGDRRKERHEWVCYCASSRLQENTPQLHWFDALFRQSLSQCRSSPPLLL